MSTPIEEARNLGPVVSEHLRASGISSVEKLRRLGWQEAWDVLRARFPRFNNLNCGYGLAGADLDIDWRVLPEEVKAEIRRRKHHI